MAVLVRFLRDGRRLVTLLLAVMLLATLGSCADSKIDRCLKLAEAYKRLQCVNHSVREAVHPRACENLAYRIADECGSITTQ